MWPQRIAILAVWAICATGAIARAEQPTTADVEGLIKKGNDLRRAGKDQVAIGYFQRAYEASPTGRTAAQLGLCEKQLGYLVPAFEHLDQALASHDEWVEKHRSVLEQNLNQLKSLTVEVLVSGTPTGAAVLVDGKVVGQIPLSAPLRVAPGKRRTITLRATGYDDGSEEVAGRGGEQVRVVLHLSRTVVTPAVVPPAQPEPAIERKGSGDSRAVQVDATTGTHPSSPLRVAAWSTGAAAVLMVGVGAAEMVIASHKKDDFQSTQAPGMTRSCGTDLPNYGGGECLSLRGDWSRARTIGLIGLTGGGVLAATSAALFVLSSPSSGDPKVACAPALPNIGLSCSGRF